MLCLKRKVIPMSDDQNCYIRIDLSSCCNIISMNDFNPELTQYRVTTNDFQDLINNIKDKCNNFIDLRVISNLISILIFSGIVYWLTINCILTSSDVLIRLANFNQGIIYCFVIILFYFMLRRQYNKVRLEINQIIYEHNVNKYVAIGMYWKLDTDFQFLQLVMSIDNSNTDSTFEIQESSSFELNLNNFFEISEFYMYNRISKSNLIINLLFLIFILILYLCYHFL